MSQSSGVSLGSVWKRALQRAEREGHDGQAPSAVTGLPLSVDGSGAQFPSQVLPSQGWRICKWVGRHGGESLR